MTPVNASRSSCARCAARYRSAMSIGPASAWATVATSRSSASENHAGVVDSSSTSPSASSPRTIGAPSHERVGRDPVEPRRRTSSRRIGRSSRMTVQRGLVPGAMRGPRVLRRRYPVEARTMSVSPSTSDTEPLLNSTMSPRRSSAIRSTVSSFGSVDAAVAMSRTSWAAASVRAACASSTSAMSRSIPGDVSRPLVCAMPES